MKMLRPQRGHRITDPEHADMSPPETGPEVYALAPPDVCPALAGSTPGLTSDVACQRLAAHDVRFGDGETLLIRSTLQPHLTG